MFFYGTYEHAIDERGRIAIPSGYRPQFGGGGVVRVGAEGCVELYTQEGFEAEAERRLSSEESTRELSARRTRRSFLAGAFPVELDKQGRILLPQPIRSMAHLNGRASIVGCGDYMEIWERDSWNAEQAAFSAAEAGSTVGAGEGTDQ
ncbi:MAG: cell division/cell wall cluster transcriptional repressor MraZ [Dehalococcoidia bacterium]|nr:cell division/cell wall cluster transcriptional repressor MraZ [Dehalococcoidia bacterium]HRC61934.1 cell division/cell wall cluster transcriptional repressor MraZ [Dehalococcoidia bacterium]